MSLLLLVASLLFPSQPCDPGTITLYEDMSYTITPSDTALVCNIEEEGNSLYDTPINVNYWQLTLIDAYTVRIDHINYTLGDPFPENVLIDTSYYVVEHDVAPAYNYVRLGNSIYSL